MRSYLIKYIGGIAVLTLVCLVAGHYVIHNVLNAQLGIIFPISVVLMFTVSVVMQVLLARSNEVKAQAFVRSYMLSTTGKLFIYLAFMMTYALKFKERAVAFIIAFFVLYIIFTAYDVMVSSKYFGRNQTK